MPEDETERKSTIIYEVEINDCERVFAKERKFAEAK